MTLTVKEFLSLPPLRRSEPVVVAGARNLDNDISWVHITEFDQPGALLSGGELVLSTGIAFPSESSNLRRIVSSLVAASASGLVIELNQRYPDGLPSELISQARDESLPLIALHRPTSFVTITRAAHELLISDQMQHQAASAHIYQSLVAIATRRPTSSEYVEYISRLLQVPVIIESYDHVPLMYSIPPDREQDILTRWKLRSNSAPDSDGAQYVSHLGWLSTPLDNGSPYPPRLIFVLDSPPRPTDYEVINFSRAFLSTTTAIRNPHDFDTETDGILLGRILGARDHFPSSLLGALRTRGFRPIGDSVFGAIIHSMHSSLNPEFVAVVRAACGDAAKQTNEAFICGALNSTSVGLLISNRLNIPRARLMERVRSSIAQAVNTPVAITVGERYTTPELWRESIQEAVFVQKFLRVNGGFAHRRAVSLRDLGINGLALSLTDQAQVAKYTKIHLEALDHLPDGGLRARTVLRALYDSGWNRSKAAEALHVSRSQFYRELEALDPELSAYTTPSQESFALYLALIFEAQGRRLRS